MLLAEQIRQTRGRRQRRSIRSELGSAAASQEGVNAAMDAAEYEQRSELDQRLDEFETALTLVFEPKVTVGSASQYYRGDKTWQTLDLAAVSGLVSALAGKAATVHLHAINDVTGLSSALSGLSDAAAGKVAKAGDTMTGPLILPTYLKAALPSASTYARSQIYVSDLTGGAEFCYSDGTSWRRMSDRSVAN